MKEIFCINLIKLRLFIENSKILKHSIKFKIFLIKFCLLQKKSALFDVFPLVKFIFSVKMSPRASMHATCLVQMYVVQMYVHCLSLVCAYTIVLVHCTSVVTSVLKIERISFNL